MPEIALHGIIGGPTHLSEERFQLIRREYLEPESEWAAKRVERVMQAAALKPGERVLDLACAFGTFCHHGAKASAHMIGLDRSATALAQGREASLRLGGRAAPRVQADACRLPFPSNCFDVIINADFIEHTSAETKVRTYSEMYHALRPGGRAIVYSPNLNKVRWELRGERVKRWLGLRGEPVPHWRDFVDPDHFGMTTPGKAARQLHQAGFGTRLSYFEFHVPLLSALPGFNSLAKPLLSGQFANRFLILLSKA